MFMGLASDYHKEKLYSLLDTDICLKIAISQPQNKANLAFELKEITIYSIFSIFQNITSNIYISLLTC